MKLGKSIEITPVHIALLTAAAQVAFGHSANLAAVRHQHRPIIIDTVILKVSAKFRVQDRPHLANRCRELMMKPETHFSQLHSEFLTRRFPFQFELACSAATAVVSESEEVERRWRTFAVSLAIATGKTPKTYQLGFLLGD